MRSSNIFKKTNVRNKKQETKLGHGIRDYRKQAVEARKRAIESLFGSQGPASSVRKIDPKTGRVIEIIDAH